MHLKINLNVNVLLRMKEPAPYLFFGFSNGFLLNPRDNEHVKRSVFYTTETIDITGMLDDIRIYEQSLQFGAGLKNKKLGLELRVELGNGFSPFTGINTAISSAYLLTSWYF